MRRFALKLKSLLKNSALGLTLAACAGAALAQSITSEPLRPVDPFDVSALDRSEGALPETLWRGSNAATARAAIERAPAPSQSAAVNRLTARALLSGGAPPDGAAGDQALAALRMETAWNIGFAEDVAELGRRTPAIEEAPDLSRLKADAELSLGQLEQACQTANRLKDGRDEAYWLQLRAVCLTRANDSAARLTEDLARAAGPDENFDTAMALAYGDEVEEVEPASPLLLAMALNSNTTIRLKLDELSPPVLTALTLGEGPEEIKPVLARKAAGMGLISAGALAEIYRSVQPPETEGVAADLMAAAMNAEGETREALMFRAAESLADPAMKADAVAEALDGARTAEDFMLTARLYRPVMANIERSGDHAMLFARAAAAGGDPELAELWRERATTPPPPPPTSSLSAPLDADGDGAPEPVSLTAPASQRASFDPPSDTDLARLNALIDLYPSARGELAVERRLDEGGANAGFEALMLSAMGGEPLSPDMRAAFLEADGGAVSGALVLTLAAAAEAGAKAETGLLAAALLGDSPAAASDADLYSAVSALRRAGLNDSAAEIAVAAVLARRR